jgi:hypothetical protein
MSTKTDLYICGGLIERDQLIDLLQNYEADYKVRHPNFKEKLNWDLSKVSFTNGDITSTDFKYTDGYLGVDSRIVNDLVTGIKTTLSMEEYNLKLRSLYEESARMIISNVIVEMTINELIGQGYTNIDDDIINDVANQKIENNRNTILNLIDEQITELIFQNNEPSYEDRVKNGDPFILNEINPRFMYRFSDNQIRGLDLEVPINSYSTSRRCGPFLEHPLYPGYGYIELSVPYKKPVVYSSRGGRGGRGGYSNRK